MQQWTQLENEKLLAEQKKAQLEADTLKCPNCKCLWFEEVALYQFKAEHSLIHGMAVPRKVGPFIFLRCVKCSELTEPRIIRQNKDNMDKFYDDLLDVLEDKDKVPVDSLVEKV